MISSLTVRNGTKPDNILLAQLGWQAFAEAFGPDNTPEDMAAYLPSAFSPDLQAAELADPQNVFWLVLVNEVPVGYIKLFAGLAAAWVTSQKPLKIARLYLLQAWCGQGIGHELLQRCLQYAQGNKYTSVWLTVWEKNERALALYKKLGFEIVGEEEFVLGQDVQRDFIMEKVL